MIEFSELKKLAKSQIKGHIGILFLLFLIEIGICAALNFIPITGYILNSFFIMPTFNFAFVRTYLDLSIGINPEISNFFNSFSDFWIAAKIYFITNLFVLLWSLLFIIPGIIKAFSYSMTIFIASENKGISTLEAIKRSESMMKGHKMEFFLLFLSFIGWILLGVITFGIAYICVIPYISATSANFYNKIKVENSVSNSSENHVETCNS